MATHGAATRYHAEARAQEQYASQPPPADHSCPHMAQGKAKDDSQKKSSQLFEKTLSKICMVDMEGARKAADTAAGGDGAVRGADDGAEAGGGDGAMEGADGGGAA